MCSPLVPEHFLVWPGGTLEHVPAGINFFSPFSSLDFRLKKDFALKERAR
jgi:hypothetical protein